MKSIAILHEGNAKQTNDNDLISLLINHLELDIKRIDFYGMNCKSNFFKPNYIAYKILKQRIKKGEVDKVLFVVDADYEKNDHLYGGFDNTEKELKRIISEIEDFQEISSLFITCDPDTKTGYLESFILSTIPEKQRNCIERFLDCSQFKPKENHKAILNQIYKMAYPNAPYNFEHKNFDDLKTKLRALFEL
ncbi:MAG: hypothetical protein KAG06_03400 [Methylococcales bacterium]|nr:hypothetical protein [Methylococcales bacterium]